MLKYECFLCANLIKDGMLVQISNQLLHKKLKISIQERYRMIVTYPISLIYDK
jgi:hypothetical protein